MTAINTDEDYSRAVRDALVRMYEWYTNPGQLLSVEQQERFITAVIGLVTPIVESEIHTGGPEVKAYHAAENQRLKEEVKKWKGLTNDLYAHSMALAGFEARASVLKSSDVKGHRALVRDIKAIEAKRRMEVGPEHP